MAERGEESSDSCSPSSVDSSPSNSSEESANEDEPDSSSISRPSGSKRKKNDSQPRSKGKATEKQQQKKNKKQNFSLNNGEMEELTSCIFSAQEAAQVEAEIRPQVAGSPRVKVFSERERFTKHMLSEEQKRIFGFSSLDFVASLPATLVTALSYEISRIGKLHSQQHG